MPTTIGTNGAPQPIDCSEAQSKQHGSSLPPHARQVVLPTQMVERPVQVLTAPNPDGQQVCASPPHAPSLHEPSAQLAPPLPHEAPFPMQVPS